MREERRVVTALCADLVGSTRLAEQLDPEEARLVVGEAVARMVHAVEGFGGTVKDLAGDGVLALFGAPAAHEDDPERAVRAALQIADEIGEYALKGKAGDVVAHAVEGAVSVPRPRVEAELVGREAELEAAAEAVEAVLAGAGGILLLTGEAGIGKSRLLGELRDLVGRRRAERQ